MIVFALAAATAEARRAPTSAERAQIAKLIGVPASCALVFVSTTGPAWASFRSSVTKACTRYASNGVTVLKRTRGRWRQVTAGSSFTCPIPKVPPSVASDLRLSCAKR